MPRIRGFLEEAVKEIGTRPGQTAREIAERLLADGRVASRAQDQRGSLVATLSKHYAEKSVRREWRDGQYRYYPIMGSEAGKADEPQPLISSSSCDALTIELSKDCKEFIDALVVLPQFKGRSEAALWLIRKGMESTRVS